MPSSSGCGRFRCSRDGGTTDLEGYFRYDVEMLPSGAVRPKASPSAIAEELRNLQRERLWTLHHRVRCPTLILRAPDGLLTATDCLMTHEEARALAAAIPKAKLVEIAGTNHYTVLMGRHRRGTRGRARLSPGPVVPLARRR